MQPCLYHIKLCQQKGTSIHPPAPHIHTPTYPTPPLPHHHIQVVTDEDDGDENKGFLAPIENEADNDLEDDLEERKMLDTSQTQRSQSHPNEDQPFFRQQSWFKFCLTFLLLN